MTNAQTTYNVHIYREMRLYYSGIAADSPEAAARIAAEKPTDQAETVNDSDGDTLAALIDVEGDAHFAQSSAIDFEPVRLQKAAASLFDTVLNVKRLAEKSGDQEADPFALLDLIAYEVHAAIAKAPIAANAMKLAEDEKAGSIADLLSALERTSFLLRRIHKGDHHALGNALQASKDADAAIAKVKGGAKRKVSRHCAPEA
jgi:hypothetical protein